MEIAPRNLKILALLLLLLVGFLAFEGVRNAQFVNFDDDKYVTENFPVQQGLSLRGLSWAFTSTYAGNWHPLTWLSHMVDCQLFGLNPAGHHLVSLFFHIANTLLLFLWLQRATGALGASFLVAGLFAVHPLHVESVAWVAERKDVLSTFFWMLTLWAYLWYVESPGLRRYLLIILCFSLGLMAKPMLVTLPMVLLLLDYWPLGRLDLKGRGTEEVAVGPARDPGPGLWRLIWEKAPLFALAAVSCLVTFYAQKTGGAVQTLEMLPLGVRLANALVSYATYMVKMLWPSRLAVFYPHPENGLPWWQILGATLTLGLISGVIIQQARRRPYLLVGWLWYLGTLVPVIGLVQVGGQALADRYTYVPLIGLFIAAAWGLADLTARLRLPGFFYPLATGALLSVLTICTWRQVGHWHDSVTLFTHALPISRKAPLVHNNLGNALFLRGKVDQALARYREALRLYPGYAEAHNNFGVALYSLGKVDQALAHYAEALRLWPTYATAHYNLAGALFALKKYEQAVSHYTAVLRFRPDDVEAYNNLGNALFMQGKVEAAVRHYLKALSLRPHHPEAHNNLAAALVSLGKVDQALPHYAAALRLAPNYQDAHYNLGTALLLKGRTELAIAHYQKVIDLNPNYYQALDRLARIRATAKEERFRQASVAIALSEQANRLTGFSQPELLDTLAAVYAEAGRFPEALQTSQKALDLAREAGKVDLAREIDQRRQLYRAGRPFHIGSDQSKAP